MANDTTGIKLDSLLCCVCALQNVCRHSFSSAVLSAFYTANIVRNIIRFRRWLMSPSQYYCQPTKEYYKKMSSQKINPKLIIVHFGPPNQIFSWIYDIIPRIRVNTPKIMKNHSAVERWVLPSWLNEWLQAQYGIIFFSFSCCCLLLYYCQAFWWLHLICIIFTKKRKEDLKAMLVSKNVHKIRLFSVAKALDKKILVNTVLFSFVSSAHTHNKRKIYLPSIK